MVQSETINTTQDYVNYTFNVEAKGVGIVTGELVGLSNTVSNILGDIAFKTSELLSNTETMAVGVSAAIGGMFVSATKSAVRFEQQMANVKAIGGESLNVQEIGNAAMEYSNKFGMATSSMTEGLEALARAGITTTSVMQGVLEEGVKLSTLEGIDLEDSINDLISTTNLLATNDVDMNDTQYAEMVKEMNQHIVSTSESAPINAQNIIQSLQHVGGYASAAGIDQDDLFAVIAQLGSRGTKGEMAGTALRAFIAAGQKDTAQRALARIGLNVSDLWDDNGEIMLSISEMKDVLDEALDARGYSKQEKLEFYSDFAGYKQANQIMKIDTSEVEHYKEQISNAWDLGQKLNVILNTVHNNINRIWQIIQNFMTRVGGKILFIANTVLTPVRMILEFVTKIPFADTAVAVGMIGIGFVGVLKIINNIIPRFTSFFIQISRSKDEMFDIRNIWRQLPDDIDRARKTLKAMSDPQQMLELQQEHQLYSSKEMGAIEDKVARAFYIEAHWNDDELSHLDDNERKIFLTNAYGNMDNISRQNHINRLKINDSEAWDEAIKEYLEKSTKDANKSASNTSYDIGAIFAQDTYLHSIDEYIKLIWREISDSGSPPSNRERNADERRESFRNVRENVQSNSSQYGDYSYRINEATGMPQFAYNDLSKMRAFEQQVLEEIRRKEEAYINFVNDKSVEAGRNRLKKSLTIAAKTDLGYEFSTGANTSDIKKILETGNIREGSSHITNEQLQDIADVLSTNVTGNKDSDMRRFYNILKNRDNKDELLDSILQVTQERWNNTYYNNGRVGFFPTKALEEASGGETARKIIEKVSGATSIADVQEHFKTVSLDDALLNECVDIMYEDKELVDTLVNEEIKYMYENLTRVQNSIRNKINENEGFRSEGEYTSNLQKAREYVLSDFDPRDYANFSASPYGQQYDLMDSITIQNDDILDYAKKYNEHLEGFQGYIYPIGTDIANSQRYGNDNFKIANIKHLPYNDLLKENVQEIFLERGDEYFDFMETFADWVYEEASYEGNYWDNSFDYNYSQIYFSDTGSGFAGTKERFDELKQELEDIYRAYIDLCAYGAQSLIESTELYGPTVTYRGGRFYTPENSFGAFDTITSTSLQWGVAKNFWNKNPHQSKILEIYNPEDIPAVVAHSDVLNEQNEHLWGRERELTLGMGQPYLHVPNPDGMEKRLIGLTADQQKAVKEIMGEDFEFKKNQPEGFLSAGEPPYFTDSFSRAYKKHANIGKNRKPINILNYIDKEDIEKSKKSKFDKYIMYQKGSNNIEDISALHNVTPIPLNKDILTKENIGQKLQDFFTKGSIITGSTGYGQGTLGFADGKGTIDIRPGVIKYYSDEDSEKWGEYGNALLDTVIHEITHTLMMHTERQNYKNNNIPAELGIDNFEIPQQLLGYRSNFVAEYEAQYVTNQVFKRLGLEVSRKNQQRMDAFESLIKHKGYGDQIQYELLDQLAEDMLANISTIGDITESLSTQWNMAEANVTSGQISEDMRPILTKIQAFSQNNLEVYTGNNANNKIDDVEQVLSGMEKDMELLWDTGISDKELIYNMVAQRYAPYIETLEDVTLSQFLEHASPTFANKGGNDLNNIVQSLINEYGIEQVQKVINNMNVLGSTSKNDNITDIILDSWNHLKTKTDGKLPLDMFYNYIEKTYGKEASDEAQKWIDDASQNVKGLLTNKDTGLSKNKKLLPEVIDKWNDKRKQVDHYEYIHLPDANIMFPLPVHKEFAENGYTLHTKGKQKGQIDRSVAQKYVHKNSAKDARSFLGIVDLLDTDFVRNLSKNDQSTLWNAIQKGENAHFDINSLIDSDNKLGKGWAALNVTTAMDCMGRLEDGSCQFCDACYAFGQAARLPEQAVKQVAKSVLFASTSAEEFADIINQNKISIVRFNQEGDFRDLDDYLKTTQIAEMSGNTQFYGYTKNQEVLDYIEKYGSPDNYQMNNSLDTWETGNYIAASWSEVLEYLEKGYELCYGACEYCKRCLDNINKVTILRDGSQKAGVDEIYAVLKKHEQHIEFFRRIAEAEQQGKQITKDFINETMRDIADATTNSTLDSFRSEGEYRRLPELGDYYSLDNRPRDERFIKSLGYGSLDTNVKRFLSAIDDAFLEYDHFNEEYGYRRLPDNHWGTRTILNQKNNIAPHTEQVGTLTSRLENFGIYYNRKTTKEAKETGIEEIVNLLNKDATKAAFMQGIISENQLKKWHTQLQDSLAVMEYGEVPWSLKDVETWRKEKNGEDTQQPWGMPGLIGAYINFKTQELAHINNLKEVSEQTIQSYKDFYTQQQEQLEEIQQRQLDNQNQKVIIEENAKKNAESYKEYYQEEADIIKERNEAIWQSYDYIKNLQGVIRGNNVAVDTDRKNNDEIDEDLLNILRTKYTKNVYEDMNKFEKARYHLKENGQNNKIIISIIDWAEKTHNKASSVISNVGNKYDDEKTQEYLGKIKGTKERIDNIATSLTDLNEGLTQAASVLPILTPLVWGLDTALWGLNMVSTFLELTETLLTVSKIQDTLVSWGLFTAEEAEAIAKGEVTATTWVLTGAIEALEAIISGPLIIAIAAVVAGIVALKIWENEHAKALKETQEQLKESVTQTKVAYSQYQSLHKARENENDAMKRQQLARKESIALYKLEAERAKQLNLIRKESDLRNDGVWGEYGARANFQKMGWLESIFAGGIPFVGTIAKWMSGDFESQYENYEGSTGEIRRIKETTLGSWGATSSQNAVSAWYDAHSRQLSQIEAFAPQLQELYDLESRLIDRYGSKEAARNSEEFNKAVQEFADATGINKETAQKYLDYLQTEANVENARYAMQAEVNIITSKAQAEAYKALYGDEAGIGELDGVQDAMVYATADQIFKDAYQELWWSMLMEWLAAIWNQLTLNFGEAQKHAKAAGAYQNGMRELAENQGRITQEGVDIARENQRKDYENDSYTSSYGDTPFGGAVASSAAQEQKYAEEEMNKQDMYYNASKANGEAATQGFKDGLDQHSPGKIARSMRAEMIFSKEAIEKGGESVMGAVYNVSDATASAFNWMGNNTNDALNGVYDATSDVFNIVSDGAEWVGGTIFNALTGGGKSIFKGFSESIKKPSNIKVDNSKTEVHIHTVNINTDDDPEKIKTALMELIVEFGDLVTPKQVSRIIGTPPTTSTSSTEDTATENENTENAENSNTNTNNTPTT